MKCGIAFQPFDADTFGGFGVEAEIAMRKATSSQFPAPRRPRCQDALPASLLRQRLQFAILRGLARQLLRRNI